jgi:catechol 2,3-dioxygenase-like lactoylglutathione lyase family enzyme
VKRTRFLAGILGLEPGVPVTRFVPLQVGGVTLDYGDSLDIRPLHIAFRVDDATFDAAYRKLCDSGIPFYADPFRREPGQINYRFGGRGGYFDDPDGHLFELMTHPGSPTAPAAT